MKGDVTMKSGFRKRSVSVALVMAAILALTGCVPLPSITTPTTATTTGSEATGTGIPWGDPTDLPDYIGAPAKPHPAANSGVPQNLLLAPNPFNGIHLDPWNSDVADIAGPLGRVPAVLSSTLEEARQDPQYPEWIFACLGAYFDSHGRLITICFSPTEATVVLADPDTLEVLDHYHLGIKAGGPYIGTGRQKFLMSLGSLYSFLDTHDQLTIVSGGDKLITLVEGGSEENPVLELPEGNTYDVSNIIPADSRISGVMLDWQGRIWFTTPDPATVLLLNPATYQQVGVKKMNLPDDEAIRNTCAVTRTGVDRTAAYVVTSGKMYRIDAGSDDQPYKV
jgi:hypothetical protein